MTSDIVRQPDKRFNYSNAVTGLFNIIKTEGTQALARGLGTNTVRFLAMKLPPADYFTSDEGCFNERKSVGHCNVNLLKSPRFRPHKFARTSSKGLV